MANIGTPIPPSWVAFPPEINTSRLQAGAGAVPMLQAAAGWEAFAISLETQADELASSLASLSQNWQGMASERALGFGGEQLLLQNRGLFDLLEARAAARSDF